MVINTLLKKISWSSLLAALALAPVGVVKAQPVCPVCTVTVFAGLGLARWFKIDDSITGVWVAGLIIAVIAWTISFLNKKKWAFRGRDFLVAAFFYLSVILPLYWTNMIGNPAHRLLGIDKLILGIATGSVAFAFALWLHSFLKKKNNDKSYFPYQKVVIPVGALVILSAIFYIICRWC